ncbi:TadE/TadG family type IV pilus assembly protein [Cognatishimia maritima]|nr:TadE/TadG family type IV pilus assembly protein [Cognatishimia maritima]
MVYLSIVIFLIILMVAGIGVDAMMAEMRRTKMQDTLDHAVIAAAALEQDLDPASVVSDYFDKADLEDHLRDIQVTEGTGYRTVFAEADTTFATQFMHLSGVDELTVNAKAGAEERIGGVEISMILDVSGSMNSNNRLPNLKVAAKDFVDTLTSTTEDGKLSISIVPYATQVSAPESFISHFNLSQEHSYSNCVNFAATDYATTSLDLGTPLTRTMHFDPWSTSDARDDSPMGLVPRPVCVDASDNSREMVILENDATRLKSFIDAMWGGGNTSIDVGMKWGTALLDASIQPAINQMIADGEVNPAFLGRPYAYTEAQTLKVIVLMTDGQNTSQYFINDAYRSGNSNIWWNPTSEVYSIYTGQDTADADGDGITDEAMFYWPHANLWRDHAYGNGVYAQTQDSYGCQSFDVDGSCSAYRTIAGTAAGDEPGQAVNLTYADLWAQTSLRQNRNANYYPWMDDNQANRDWYNRVRNFVGHSTKNARTQAICDSAKAEGIIVFTIGFEAPEAGQAVLQNCASSANHYFDVQGLEIADAFAAIAASIRQLRLTQ